MPSAALVARSLLRGLALRCPACGARTYSDGVLDTKDACARCGAAFEPARGEFTGAMMFGQGAVGMLALGLYFVAEVLYDVPLWLGLAWIVVFAVLVPLVTYRHVKGAWVGAMHAFGGLRPPGPNAGP